ncbi:MAG: hypothetical protein GY906_08655 [bacterium]|nr:hypothetical protein [bacterium]
MYAELRRLITENHDDLTQARIALAFNLSWKPDVDGRLQLGMMKVASDLDRELADYDLIIVLNRAFWGDPKVTDEQRTALLDHELSHGALQRAKNLEPIEDEKGRKCYRIRKHDIEEFSAVASRHGMWKKDIEAFWKALQKGRQRTLFDQGEGEEPIAAADGENLVARDEKGELIHMRAALSPKASSE